MGRWNFDPPPSPPGAPGSARPCADRRPQSPALRCPAAFPSTPLAAPYRPRPAPSNPLRRDPHPGYPSDPESRRKRRSTPPDSAWARGAKSPILPDWLGYPPATFQLKAAVPRARGHVLSRSYGLSAVHSRQAVTAAFLEPAADDAAVWCSASSRTHAPRRRSTRALGSRVALPACVGVGGVVEFVRLAEVA